MIQTGRVVDITGEKYGRLTVVKYVKLSSNNKAIWECKCDCGKIVEVISNGLRSGNTKSCGCQNIDSIMERNTTHNGTHTRIYSIWEGMKGRCSNPNDTVYKYYGGKGIKVCEEWINKFEGFREWAFNNGYKENLTIDRIDVNGNYESSNCRWITIQEQQRNKTNTVKLTIGEVTDTLTGWSKRSRIKYMTLRDRYYKGKKDIELFKPSIRKINFIGENEYKRQLKYYLELKNS